MLMRLKGSGRTAAGRVLALAYLLCILAPAFAFAGEAAAAPCFGGAHQPGAHHGPSTMGEHAGHHARAMIDPAFAATLPPGEQHPDQRRESSFGPCCSLLCVGALAMVLNDIFPPAKPNAVRAQGDIDALADHAPARLYRPPIL
jgi:hypothetical protein